MLFLIIRTLLAINAKQDINRACKTRQGVCTPSQLKRTNYLAQLKISVQFIVIWIERQTIMNAVLSPIVSEFETQEVADAYDVWFRAKVQASIDDPRPSIPHDQVMDEIQAFLTKKQTEFNAG